MKKLIILALCSCFAIACESDFDEINDTKQRQITFNFNPDVLFMKYLDYDGNIFKLNSIDTLPNNKRVRITTYCYDECDSLIHKDVQITPLNQYKPCKIKHLNKNVTYNFLFIADIINYDSASKYLETWFQMQTKSLNNFYLYSDQRKEAAADNLIGFALVKIQPSNQTCTIDFNPLTYNGYIILNNSNEVSMINGFASYTVSFKPITLEQIFYGSIGYEFKYVSPQDKTIVIPVTLCYVDDAVKSTINLHKLNISKEINLLENNKAHSPFVVKIDCSTMTLTSYETY